MSSEREIVDDARKSYEDISTHVKMSRQFELGTSAQVNIYKPMNASQVLGQSYPTIFIALLAILLTYAFLPSIYGTITLLVSGSYLAWIIHLKLELREIEHTEFYEDDQLPWNE